MANLDSNTVFKPLVKPVRMGIDVGSTTVKVVILGDDDALLYGAYERHRRYTQHNYCRGEQGF